MNSTQAQVDLAAQVMGASVKHARNILATQLPDVQNRTFDFMPRFNEMTAQLYPGGVTWRFGEQFDLPIHARERGFISLMYMLVSDGMNEQKAQKRIAHLNLISRAADGKNNVAIAADYGASKSDASRAAVYEKFRGIPEVSGAPYRLLDRSKPIAIILAIAGFLLALLFDKSWGVALGIGILL